MCLCVCIDVYYVFDAGMNSYGGDTIYVCIVKVPRAVLVIFIDYILPFIFCCLFPSFSLLLLNVVGLRWRYGEGVVVCINKDIPCFLDSYAMFFDLRFLLLALLSFVLDLSSYVPSGTAICSA